jgi:hypothetical protein
MTLWAGIGLGMMHALQLEGIGMWLELKKLRRQKMGAGMATRGEVWQATTAAAPSPKPLQT